MKNRIYILVSVLLAIGILSLQAAATPVEAFEAYNRGVDLAVEGKFPEALDSIDEALRSDGNFTLAWVTRAGILNAMGMYNESLEASSKAIQLDENQSEAWTNRASALIFLSRYEEALEAADRAIMIDPRLSEAWIDRAEALFALGRMEEADEAMKMVQFLTGTATVPAEPVATTPSAGLSWVIVPAGLAVAGIRRLIQG